MMSRYYIQIEKFDVFMFFHFVINVNEIGAGQNICTFPPLVMDNGWSPVAGDCRKIKYPVTTTLTHKLHVGSFPLNVGKSYVTFSQPGRKCVKIKSTI